MIRLELELLCLAAARSPAIRCTALIGVAIQRGNACMVVAFDDLIHAVHQAHR
jgi:hypothetical protein